jgi:hypothetical protein
MDTVERNDIDSEAERIDQDGHAWLDTDEVLAVEVKRPLDKVIPVRLSAEHWRALRKEAGERGVGPTTLVRMWVLEKLRDVQKAGQVA